MMEHGEGNALENGKRGVQKFMRRSTKKSVPEVWCMAKSSENEAKTDSWQGLCQGCCAYCDKRPCSLRVCTQSTKEDLCYWRASLFEWLMSRISEKARMETYKRRRIESYLKEGYRPNDNTWEGNRLKEWKEKYPDVYEEIYKKICKSTLEKTLLS